MLLEHFVLKLNLMMKEAASKGQQRGSQQRVPGARFPDNGEFFLRTSKLRKIWIMLHEGFLFLSLFLLSSFPPFLSLSVFLKAKCILSKGHFDLPTLGVQTTFSAVMVASNL